MKFTLSKFLLFLLSFHATSFAASDTAVASSALPKCFKAENQIAEIRSTQTAHRKDSRKYDGYRSLLHAESGLQLAARLVYAETLAASCETNELQVIDVIASVIGNRVRIRNGDVGSVVFQRDQFSSSLNIYPESRYRDFICPTNSELWRKVIQSTRENLESRSPTAKISGNTVNYYLYRHSKRFKAPDWRIEEARVGDATLHECIRAFKNPSWK